MQECPSEATVLAQAAPLERRRGLAETLTWDDFISLVRVVRRTETNRFMITNTMETTLVQISKEPSTGSKSKT